MNRRRHWITLVGLAALDCSWCSTHQPTTAAVCYVSLTPASAIVEVGHSVPFGAVGQMPDWTACTASITWMATGGTVGPGGIYTAGPSVGSFQVTASAGSGQSVTAPVTVVAGGKDEVVLVDDLLTTALDASPPASSGLSVTLEDLAPAGTESVILVSAQTSPTECSTYMVRRVGEFLFNNLLTIVPPCRDEIVTFSIDDPVVLDEGDGDAGGIWSDVGGETRPIKLGSGLREVPIVVWVTIGTVNGDDVVTRVKNDFQTASFLFNANRTGIVLAPEIKEPYRAPESIDPNAAEWSWCTKPVAHYQSGTINVYYVDNVSAFYANDLGRHCRDVDWNLIYIWISASSETTLPHELGHAFSLNHTGDAGIGLYGTEFTKVNLMWQGEIKRTTLSLGQAFRITLEANSALAKNGIWQGTTRECACRIAGVGTMCPGMASPSNQTLIQQSSSDGACPSLGKAW